MQVTFNYLEQNCSKVLEIIIGRLFFIHNDEYFS